MKKYSIGVDFGTLSARALLVDLENGREVAVSEAVYTHKILKDDFFKGVKLEATDALQHPQDYLDALKFTVNEVLQKGNISAGEILGICFDFTSCTILPVTEDGTPLCFLDEYKNNPHAYVKLWKHHSAEKEADEITALAKKEAKPWLDSYGGKVSSEWMFPKILEILHKAPSVYENTGRFIEAADWLVWLLTGKEVHSSCMAGYKGLWNKKSGFVANSFWEKIDKGLKNIVGTKVCAQVAPVGSKAGEITKKGEELTGISKGTAVAASLIDAHATLPAAGIVEEGKLMLIIGTSSCHIVMSKEEKNIKGICGCVKDGVIEGYAAYEAGQCCVGDSFEWFIKNCVPKSYIEEANKCGKNIFALMDEKAACIKESEMVALDWWNGNRTPYIDSSLKGVIAGLTLTSKPEEIYRAILESVAFGTRAIVELYEKNGIEIKEIYAAGGISQKNTFLMQIYADVLGKSIKIVPTINAGAKGSAIFAAVAGGYYSNVREAADVIRDKCEKVYCPDESKKTKYDVLYEKYTKMSEFFAGL